MGRTFEEESQIDLDRYFGESYFKREQFDQLINQLIAVKTKNPSSVLEIGKGNGFVAEFLKLSGIKVTTFDINPNLKPDIVGNIVEIDKYFDENSFDLILCAEVLEHIPFDNFEKILLLFQKISKKYVIITLPRSLRILVDFRFYLKVPLIKYLKINFFKHIPLRDKWEGHQWQIDYQNYYSLKNVKMIIKKYFNIEECYIDERIRTIQIFILKLTENEKK